jgi:hypothetical protein
MVNQHKHGDRVKKRKKEDIWSSVTGEMEKFEKYSIQKQDGVLRSTAKNMYRQKVPKVRREKDGMR